MQTASVPVQVIDVPPPADRLHGAGKATLDSPPARFLANIGRSHHAFIPAESHPTMQSWWEACDDARDMMAVLGWAKACCPANEPALGVACHAVLRALTPWLNPADRAFVNDLGAWLHLDGPRPNFAKERDARGEHVPHDFDNPHRVAQAAVAMALCAFDGDLPKHAASGVVQDAAIVLGHGADNTAVAERKAMAALAHTVREVVRDCPVVLCP